MGRGTQGNQHGGSSGSEEVSEKFMAMTLEELGEMDALIAMNEINSEDLDYLWEWMTRNRWSAFTRDIVLWLHKMPYRGIV